MNNRKFLLPKFFLIVTLMIVSLSAHGETKLDSLLKLLPSTEGLARAKVLYAIAFELITVDNERARITNVQKAHLSSVVADMVKRLNSSKGLCNVAALSSDDEFYELIGQVSGRDENSTQQLRN